MQYCCHCCRHHRFAYLLPLLSRWCTNTTTLLNAHLVCDSWKGFSIFAKHGVRKTLKWRFLERSKNPITGFHPPEVEDNGLEVEAGRSVMRLLGRVMRRLRRLNKGWCRSSVGLDFFVFPVYLTFSS